MTEATEQLLTMRSITVRKASQKFGAMRREVAETGEPTLVTLDRDHKPSVVLVPWEQYRDHILKSDQEESRRVRRRATKT
jgi:PHD/YefM family antitoxin component YafN of YafNO toxin-antitoxin module